MPAQLNPTILWTQGPGGAVEGRVKMTANTRLVSALEESPLWRRVAHRYTPNQMEAGRWASREDSELKGEGV